MRRILMATVSAMLVGTPILWISPAMAGQPQDVIINTAEYPSGPHFNLNVHGKDPSTFLYEEVLSGVKSVFIDEYGESTTQYISNKKSNITGLMVQEVCAGCFNEPLDDTPTKVIVPYEREDLYVFSRVRTISDNEQNGSNPDSIRFHPNLLGNARNVLDPAIPDSPFSIEPPDAQLLKLESNTIRYVHDTTPEEFVTYDLATAKGKTKPSDVARLFKWLGSFFAASILDENSDGKTDAYVFTFIRYY
ncbi:MAG: hypothetical protein PVJ50_07430 [Desulfobacterales bacterium]|jgi:hypothetical protein